MRQQAPTNKATLTLRYALWVVLMLFAGTASAEDEHMSLKAKIKQLVVLRQATLNAPNDEVRIQANKDFTNFMRDALSDQLSFETSFDTIPGIADMRSPDNFFRMINWNLPLDNQTHRYYCFIQYYNRKDKTYELVELKQGYHDVKGGERKYFNDKDWYGALYYKIIPVKRFATGRKRSYVLLGWDGHNEFSSIKLIDVMTIMPNQIRFGADLFEYPEKSYKRIVLEYKSDASVSLRYDDQRNMIVFNQLVPMEPDLEGLPEFYIPVIEFDAFVWKKRKWRYIQNVTVKQRDDRSVKYNDPPMQQQIRR